MPRSILALDLAKVTGYAHWKEGDSKPSAGVLDVSKVGNVGDRLASLYKWGLRVTKEWGVTDIAIEAPIAGGGDINKIIWLISCYGIFKMLGSQCRIDVEKIDNSDFFPHWCGTNRIEGDQRKTYSVLECQRRGFPHITDHNTADAMGVLSFRCSQLGLRPPWDYQRSPGPLFTGSSQGHKTPQGVRITTDNRRMAAILTNRIMHKGK